MTAIPLEIPTVVAPTVRGPASVDATSTAELVECTCPEWCERDHDRD